MRRKRSGPPDRSELLVGAVICLLVGLLLILGSVFSAEPILERMLDEAPRNKGSAMRLGDPVFVILSVAIYALAGWYVGRALLGGASVPGRKSPERRAPPRA